MLTMIFNKKIRVVVSASLVFTLLLLTGCGEAEKPTGAISGTVKSGEKMIGDCKVAIFHLESMGSIAAAVDESGTFELKNVPLGDYQVKVYPKPSYGSEETRDPRIPKKFRDFKESGITVSVVDAEPTVLDIDLK